MISTIGMLLTRLGLIAADAAVEHHEEPQYGLLEAVQVDCKDSRSVRSD